jgi:hypothetical protein
MGKIFSVVKRREGGKRSSGKLTRVNNLLTRYRETLL